MQGGPKKKAFIQLSRAVGRAANGEFDPTGAIECASNDGLKAEAYGSCLVSDVHVLLSSSSILII